MQRQKAIYIWVLCFVFGYARPSSAQQEAGASRQATTGAQTSPEPHVTEGRLKINLHSQEMTVAVDNQIPLDLHGYSVRGVMLGWEFAQPGIEGSSVVEPAVVPLQHSPEGSAYVDFIPIRLGKIRLRILVSFQDGGFDDGSVDLNVDHSTARPCSRSVSAVSASANSHSAMKCE